MSDRHLELGLFAPTVGTMPPAGKPGAFLLSHVEQRTEPTFEYNLRLAQMLDQAGLELFFMAQRGGKGFGPSRFWGTSLDSFTTASALAMATEQLQLISTVHTAFFHPGLVARIGATLDQICKGRWRLNIVSGWAENDFRMLDIPLIEHDDRYRRSAEFVEVITKFWTEDWFDYTGKFFTINQGTCAPKPASPPLLYNAGSSPAGREFAARYCDWFFTAAVTPEAIREEVADVQARAAKYGRKLRIIIYALTICRESEAAAQQEIEEILAQGDYEGAKEFLEGISGQTIGTTKSILGEGGLVEDMLKSLILGIGGSNLTGPPEKVAHDLAALHEAGVDAIGLTFRHTQEELADFIEQVVPLLEQQGVRASARGDGDTNCARRGLRKLEEPMAVLAQQSLMTAEELFGLPSDDYKYELVAGELIRMAPTGGEHGVSTIGIGRILDEYVEAHDLGICSGAETGFILQRSPDIVRAPDAAFIAKARIPKTYWPFAPDLAVEVTSPSDRFTAVQTKVAEYFSAGTRLVWVVEPATRTVYLYRSPHDVQALGEDGELSGEDVLPGFRCAVRRLFP